MSGHWCGDAQDVQVVLSMHPARVQEFALWLRNNSGTGSRARNYSEQIAAQGSGARLVVIDPEDVAAMEALAAAYRDQQYAELTESPMSVPAMHMRQALREFANPAPPKPEEPTGLGAVVEDANGKVYVRGYWPDDTFTHPWHVIDPAANMRMSWWRYDDIEVAAVLSEGVTP